MSRRSPGNEKKSTLRGLFSTKEPSKQALKEYEEFLRREEAESIKRQTAIRVASISDAKLPAHVPKVNSRWDGMPRRTKKPKSHLSTTSKSWLESSNMSSKSSLFSSISAKSRSWPSSSVVFNSQTTNSMQSSSANITTASTSPPSTPDTVDILANMCSGYNQKHAAKAFNRELGRYATHQLESRDNLHGDAHVPMQETKGLKGMMTKLKSRKSDSGG